VAKEDHKDTEVFSIPPQQKRLSFRLWDGPQPASSIPEWSSSTKSAFTFAGMAAVVWYETMLKRYRGGGVLVGSFSVTARPTRLWNPWAFRATLLPGALIEGDLTTW